MPRECQRCGREYDPDADRAASEHCPRCGWAPDHGSDEFLDPGDRHTVSGGALDEQPTRADGTGVDAAADETVTVEVPAELAGRLAAAADTDPAAAVAAAARSVDDMERPGEWLQESGVL